MNEEFIQAYPNELRQYMEETSIEITAKESIGHCGQETTVIQRVLFLPSYTELGGIPSRTILQEGFRYCIFPTKRIELPTMKMEKREVGGFVAPALQEQPSPAESARRASWVRSAFIILSGRWLL